MAKKPNGHLKSYKTYRFTGQDPIIEIVHSIVDDSGLRKSEISNASGVASGTMGNWFRKKTRRPQFATVNAVLMACDKELVVSTRK